MKSIDKKAYLESLQAERTTLQRQIDELADRLDYLDAEISRNTPPLTEAEIAAMPALEQMIYRDSERLRAALQQSLETGTPWQEILKASVFPKLNHQ